MVMNGLVIVLIGIVALGAGYLLYGRWLAKKWGLDPKAKTPAFPGFLYYAAALAASRSITG